MYSLGTCTVEVSPTFDLFLMSIDLAGGAKSLKNIDGYVICFFFFWGEGGGVFE